MEVLLPPHEQINKSSARGSSAERPLRPVLGRSTKPNVTIAHHAGESKVSECEAARVREVVVTLTVNVEAVAAFTVRIFSARNP
jgi:hypothetical protein